MKDFLYNDLYQLEDKHWWHIAKRELVIHLINYCTKKLNPKILDIGCGTGKNIESLQKIGPTSGIDSSSKAIAFCRKRKLSSVTLGSAESTHYSANTFDLVTLLDVLEHTDDDKTLLEVYRILKPGGLMVITVPAYQSLWSQWDVILHHKRRYSKETLIKIVTKYHFSPLKVSYVYSFLLIPIYLIRVIKSNLYRNNYNSDFRLNTPVINIVLLFIARIEIVFITRWGIPFGTSIICVAKKHYENK